MSACDVLRSHATFIAKEAVKELEDTDDLAERCLDRSVRFLRSALKDAEGALEAYREEH